jgi:predicted nucleic acid-binding protein
MTSDRIDIRRYSFSASDRFLFDANIWLLLNGPVVIPPDWRVEVYSRALKEILARGCAVFIEAAVLSEFANRYAKHCFEKHCTLGQTFKEFRDSMGFSPFAQIICDEIHDILAIATPIGCGLDQMNRADILREFAAGGADFNDLLICETCRIHSLTLVTHDRDFQNAPVRILTAHSRLLPR